MDPCKCELPFSCFLFPVFLSCFLDNTFALFGSLVVVDSWPWLVIRDQLVVNAWDFSGWHSRY
jgi:hypothetical protein